MFGDLTRCWQQSLRERAAGARTDVRILTLTSGHVVSGVLTGSRT